MKYLVLIIKRIVMSICLLYAVNLIVYYAGINIVINYVSIGFTAVFGFPAIIGLVIMQKML